MAPLFIWPSDERILLAPLVGLTIGLLLLAYYYILWYFTIFIVTTDRIRQISQKSFFQKDVVDLDISKVHGISYSVPGFSASLFHFGTIVVQTMVGDLVVSHVAQSERVYNRLQNAVDQASRKRETSDKEHS
jgi:hypothetical protein